mgnify:CR=1 FL=1
MTGKTSESLKVEWSVSEWSMNGRMNAVVSGSEWSVSGQSVVSE